MMRPWVIVALGAVVGCGGATTNASSTSARTVADQPTSARETEFDEAYWAEAPAPLELPEDVGTTTADVVPCDDLREPMPQPRVHVRPVAGGLTIRHLVRVDCGAQITPLLEHDGAWLQLTTTVVVAEGGEQSCDSVARAAISLPAGEYEVWIIEERSGRTQQLYVGNAEVP